MRWRHPEHLDGPTLTHMARLMMRWWPQLSHAGRLRLVLYIYWRLVMALLALPFAVTGALGVGLLPVFLAVPLGLVSEVLVAVGAMALVTVGLLGSLSWLVRDITVLSRWRRAQLLRSLVAHVTEPDSALGRGQGGAASSAAVVAGAPPGFTTMDELSVAAERKAPRHSVHGFVFMGVVIATLAAAALPSVYSFNCRSGQTEAKSMLRTIYAAEAQFHAEFGRYATLDELETSTLGARYASGRSLQEGRRYRVTLELVGAGYAAAAEDRLNRVSPHATPDRWTMDETGGLSHLVDSCAP